MSLVIAEKLSRSFGATEAVRALDFSVESGQIVGFIGKNGAGKTTTMRMLAGTLHPTSGQALIAGHNVVSEAREARRAVGYLPERPPVYPDMGVEECLGFVAGLRGIRDVRGAVARSMDLTGLAGRELSPVSSLSKGFLQRLGIAQAIVHRPRLLLLDEPLSGLDPGQRKHTLEMLRSLADDGVAVILSTHILAEIQALCDQALVIERGQLVASGGVDAIGASRHTFVIQLQDREVDLSVHLGEVEQVESVERLSVGRWKVRATADVRATCATAAAEFGLLELRSERDLEAVFLEATEES